MKSLEGKVALVTGAASGIGLAVARDLAQQGVRVTLCDLDAEAGQREADALPNARFCRANLARKEELDRLVQETLEAEGQIDILVNNAGLQHVAPITEFPEEKWRSIIEVMLTAPFLLTQAVLPSMYERKWGRIINIGSVHSLRASAFKSAYVAAKHGLLGLTRVTALEAAPYGVTCNLICPSYVRTPLVEKQIKSQAAVHHIPEEEVVEKVMVAEGAIKRLLEPEEVAQLVTYLCSDAASAITGSSQVIDCGWTAH
ncbi:3-hydroxybutyrate dehydrogenase [Thermosporothrix hazakensis]|jgi:3-hydroxybutyrate dehydrogenase|uniref:3-hydroxybutyrate dehydrogenase n=1 Tax=Thermosporothrix hazakensis TaxID=644383 RepID=A0A326U0U8_THEHA|nr:3-hydroxybutyrate dehydrogenase [Thermosporothrix hazakensis]PZW24068.1 3-hydroxybutyrate dehydrogenase [Thermosporothrix hazakensis]GCE50280.1 3-hydroxybutyrate dehydrogenase [Thermosporothrix hazakensis]